MVYILLRHCFRCSFCAQPLDSTSVCDGPDNKVNTRGIVELGFPFFRKKNVQPGALNSPEKHLRTRNYGFQPGNCNYLEISRLFPGFSILFSNLEKLLFFRVFRVGTRNPEFWWKPYVWTDICISVWILKCRFLPAWPCIVFLVVYKLLRDRLGTPWLL